MGLWSKRRVALGGLFLALGCRSANSDLPYAQTPLLPGVEGTPIVSGPVLPASPTGSPIVANGPAATPPILPPGAVGPQHAPYALVRPLPPIPTGSPVLPPPREVTSLPDNPPANSGPALPAIVLPNDVATPSVEGPKIVNKGAELLPLPQPARIPGPQLTGDKPAEKDPFQAASRIITPPESPTIIRQPSEEKTAKPVSIFPLKPGQKFGHADDYRWVAGVMDYHQRGGYWTIRYMDYSEDDRWGGKVRLVDDSRLRDCNVGDVVYVSGELLAPLTSTSTEARINYPPFRIAELKVIEKAK